MEDFVIKLVSFNTTVKFFTMIHMFWFLDQTVKTNFRFRNYFVKPSVLNQVKSLLYDVVFILNSSFPNKSRVYLLEKDEAKDAKAKSNMKNN